jgi:probable HAF family extracellular repeat protein
VAFGVQPALDTVEVGDTVWFVAQRGDSTVDEWTVSDSSIARIFTQQGGRAGVLTIAAGTVTIEAKCQGASGQATLVVLAPPPPPPDTTHQARFSIQPALDTADIGYAVQFTTQGADGMVDEWVLSDTNIASVVSPAYNWAHVLPRAAGTLTVTARRHGDTAQARLVIPPSPTPVGWEAITLRLDGCDVSVNAFNDSGTVVGAVREPPCDDRGVMRAVVYANGILRTLPWTAGGDAPEPQAIGPSGTIVGAAGRDTPALFVWAAPDAMPQPLSGSLLYVNRVNYIVGVNARGDIVADSGDSLGSLMALLWRDGVRQDLGSLKDPLRRTYARALNNRGQIVGGSSIARFFVDRERFDAVRPFLWEDGVMRNLGVLASPSPCRYAPTVDCSWADAQDINADGVVVGRSSADTLFRAFIWEDGAMRDLGVFPGHTTAAWQINDRGQVIGSVGSAYLGFEGRTDTTFFWDAGHVQIVVTATRSMPTLTPNGKVLGSMRVAGDSLPHAFIWQAGYLTDLGRGVALTINSRGEIIGRRGVLGTLWRKKP